MGHELPRDSGTGPLEMPELMAAGLSVREASMLAWPVSDDDFAAFLRSRRELSEEDVERVERKRSADQGPYQPHHHHVEHSESRH